MPFDPAQWTFLGDGIYVKWENGQVVISTAPGDPETGQTIYLEAQVMNCFSDWLGVTTETLAESYKTR